MTQFKPLHGTARPQVPFAFVEERLVYITMHFAHLVNTRNTPLGSFTKLRILHRPRIVKLDLSAQIVDARCVLHNCVRSRGYNFEATFPLKVWKRPQWTKLYMMGYMLITT
ncbi:hypothetical protein PR048_018305 [Dryococelus australis]|uniref:Uncharacterized protein n=1 Tax=Dryococelus australis TaxID=614101 RepID=A0ABQ9HC29_9NEOP|nr:hypothetical protein PR048_018305 [Dryococelus australis]